MNTRPKKDKDGYITNARCLTADDVTKEKVLCPFCRFQFQKWPVGWDAHASSPDKCNLRGDAPKKRKREFKEELLHLFQNKDMSRYK